MFEWIEINVVSSDDWFNCSNFCDDIESSISCNGFTLLSNLLYFDVYLKFL